jgi:hypothetical protein
MADDPARCNERRLVMVSQWPRDFPSGPVCFPDANVDDEGDAPARAELELGREPTNG